MDPTLSARAEACWTELGREQYEALAGLKTRPELGAIYRRWADLFAPDRLSELAAAAAREGTDRRARHLLEFLVATRAELEAGELLDERLAWEATATLAHAGERLTVRQAPRVIANVQDPAVRARLERQRLDRLREVEALDRRRFEGEWAVFGEHGRDYVSAWERLSGIRTAPLAAAAQELLEATEPVYRELLGAALRREGVDPRRAGGADRLRLERAAQLDDYVADHDPLAVATVQLGELGLDIHAGGRLRMDLAERPEKWARPFCSVLQVPSEVMLVLSPTGGWRDWYAFFHELGHALHFANVDASLPFEERALGDISVTETFARLFELAPMNRRWLERYLGLSRARGAEFIRAIRLIDLMRLRRQVGKLQYELELHAAGSFDGMAERYATILTEATGFEHDPAAYLDDIDMHLYTARYLRSWALEALLAAALRNRFDEDWFRNPSAGPYLLELFAGGQREDADELSRRVAGAELGFAALLGDIEQAFA
jgi:hypothetical protein